MKRVRSDDAWMTEAICSATNPDDWFVDEQHIHAIAMLRMICSECPVITQCREYALKRHAYGFWGGMTQSERSRIRRRVKSGGVA